MNLIDTSQKTASVTTTTESDRKTQKDGAGRWNLLPNGIKKEISTYCTLKDLHSVVRTSKVWLGAAKERLDTAAQELALFGGCVNAVPETVYTTASPNEWTPFQVFDMRGETLLMYEKWSELQLFNMRTKEIEVRLTEPHVRSAHFYGNDCFVTATKEGISLWKVSEKVAKLQLSHSEPDIEDIEMTRVTDNILALWGIKKDSEKNGWTTRILKKYCLTNFSSVPCREGNDYNLCAEYMHQSKTAVWISPDADTYIPKRKLDHFSRMFLISLSREYLRLKNPPTTDITLHHIPTKKRFTLTYKRVTEHDLKSAFFSNAGLVVVIAEDYFMSTFKGQLSILRFAPNQN